MRYVLAGAVVGGGQMGSHNCVGLVLDGTRIVRLISADEPLPSPSATGLLPESAQPAAAAAAAVDVGRVADVLDFRPHLLAPGTIDVHVHGGAGWSFSTADDAGVQDVCRYRASAGVTGILPTVTGRWGTLLGTLETLGQVAGDAARNAGAGGTRGAAVLGIHVEGPFINPSRKGAISRATMMSPDLDSLRRLQDAAEGWIKMMTVAPELPGALPLIEEMVRLGIVPSIGHSDATYEQVLDAASAGARKSTHTYNAMRALQHRDPGTVGGILADDRLVAELIADGVHVHRGAMRVLLRAKGSALIALVTDGVDLSGLPDGIYQQPATLGAEPVTVSGGAAHLGDGTLAGSALPINCMLRLLREDLDVPLDDLFMMAATVPARLLGHARKGSLRAGADADFAIFDVDLRCLATFVAGTQVFAAPVNS